MNVQQARQTAQVFELQTQVNNATIQLTIQALNTTSRHVASLRVVLTLFTLGTAHLCWRARARHALMHRGRTPVF